MAASVGILECRECRLSFETKKQHEIHTRRFCVKVGFVDAKEHAQAAKKEYEKYRNRMEAKAPDPDMDLLDKEVLVGEEADLFMLERRKDSYKKQGELQSHRAELQADSSHEDKIRTLLEELEKTKENEIEAILKREKFSRNLKDMDRRHLEAQQEEKRKELMAVQKEREEMEAVESAYREELEAMQSQQAELAESMATESTRMAKETKESDNSAQQSYLIQQRELGKDYGLRVAQMQSERLEKLEQQRNLQQQLESLQRGELPVDGITVGGLTVRPADVREAPKVSFDDLPAAGARETETVEELVERLKRTQGEDQARLKGLRETGRPRKDEEFDDVPGDDRPLTAQLLEDPNVILEHASNKFHDAVADTFMAHENGSEAIAEATGISKENMQRKVDDHRTKFPPIAVESPRPDAEEMLKEQQRRAREKPFAGSPQNSTKLPHLTPQRSFSGIVEDEGVLGSPQGQASTRSQARTKTMRASYDGDQSAALEPSQYATPQRSQMDPNQPTPGQPQDGQQEGQQSQPLYGYPPQQPGYPPQQPGYPPQPGYPTQQQQPPYGYPPPPPQQQQQLYGYPPQQPYGYPPQNPMQQNPMQQQLMQMQQQAQMLMQQHAQENQMLDELQRGVDPSDTGAGGATGAVRARTDAEIQHEEMNMQHQRMMEQMAWQMEQLQVSQQLQALKDADEKRQRDRELVKRQEEARLALEEAKLRKRLVKELPGTVLSADEPRVNPQLYDPKAGFSIFADFVSGMPRKALQCAVIYGIYEGNTPKMPAKMLPMLDTDDAGPDGKMCVIATNRSFQNVPANDKLLLVLEPQISMQVSSDPTQKAPTKALGWTTIPIFRKGDTGLLNAGLYRLPLFRPPVTPATPHGQLNDKAKVYDRQLGEDHATDVYIRIVSNTSPLERTINDNFKIDPETTKSQYYKPYSEGRGAYAERQFRAPQVLTESRPQPPPEPATETDAFDTPEPAEVHQSPRPSPKRSPAREPEPEPEPEPVLEQRNGGRSSSHLSNLQAAGMMDAHAQRARVHVADQRQTIYAMVDKLQNYSPQADVSVKLRVVPMYQAGDILLDGGGKECTVAAHRGDSVDVRSGGREFSVDLEDVTPQNDRSAVKPLASGTRHTEPRKMKPSDVGSISFREDFTFQNTRAHVSTGLLVTVHSVEHGLEDLIGWSKLDLFSNTGGGEEHLSFQAGSHDLRLMLPPTDLADDLDDLDPDSQVGNATIKIRVSTDSFAGQPLSREHTPAGSRPGSRVNTGRSSKNGQRGDQQRGSSRGQSKAAGRTAGPAGFASPEGGEDTGSHKLDYRTRAMSQEVGTGRRVKVSKEAWRHCENIPDPHPETAPSGIDLYLDGCRGLPDNATITRVDFEIRASNHDAFGKSDNSGKSVIDVNTKIFNPHVTLRHEIREQGSVDPMATVLLIVRTIDRFTQASATVGYAVLNVFMDARPGKDGVQPESQNVKDFILNAGGHELPLHKFPPPANKALSVGSCDEIPAVVCATVLVRLHEAAKSADGLRVLSTNDVDEKDWEANGLVVPMPEYRNGVYDSTRVARVMTEQSGKLFNRRLQTRDDVSVKDSLVHAGEDGEQVRIKPEPEITTWMEALLESNKPNGRDVPMDYAYIAEYDPDEGFDLAVDSVRGLHRTVWSSVTHCVGPPASFYADPPLTKNVNLTLAHDLSSDAKNPSYNDGLVKYPAETYKANKCAIIAVHTLEKPWRAKEYKLESIAWAILPLFHETGQYLRTGAYRLPLFVGIPFKGLIADLDLGKPPLEALDASIRSNQARPYEWGSVVVRLVDYWRAGEFASAPDPGLGNPDKLNIVFIPEAHRDQHKDERNAKDSDTLEQLADKKTPPDFFRDDMNKELAKGLNITHIAGL